MLTTGTRVRLTVGCGTHGTVIHTDGIGCVVRLDGHHPEYPMYVPNHMLEREGE